MLAPCRLRALGFHDDELIQGASDELEKMPARSRRSNHPLLRVAFDDGPTKALLNALRDDLRSAYDASIPLADRRRRALAAVTTLRLLDLKESDALDFRARMAWEGEPRPWGRSLLEALAEADLRAVGVETCSSAWFQTGNDLDHFAMPDLRGLHEERERRDHRLRLTEASFEVGRH